MNGRYRNPRHSVPRTAAAAKRMGLERVDMSLDELGHAELSEWFIFERPSKSSRAPCGVIPLPDGRYKICFLDPKTGRCNLCYISNHP